MPSTEPVLPLALEGVRRFPGMYFGAVGFDSIVAFLVGYSCADSGALIGFKEWLLVLMNDRGITAFLWEALLKMQLDRSGVAPQGDGAVEFRHGDRRALLEGQVREGGVRESFRKFEEWSGRQQGA